MYYKAKLLIAPNSILFRAFFYLKRAFLVRLFGVLQP